MKPLVWAPAIVLAVALLGACASDSSSGPGGSESGSYPAALTATPLEARDALKSLDVFLECGDAADLDEGRSTFIKCYVADPSEGDAGSAYRRGVSVIIFRSSTAAQECAGILPESVSGTYEVVTDNETFVALGEMNDAVLDNSWTWPAEVWPADVARVLGGKVMALEDWCTSVQRS